MLKKIGIIFGGNSTEHDASIHSYFNVMNSFVLDKKIKTIKKVIYIKGNNFFVFKNNFPKSESELTPKASLNLKKLVKELDGDLYWFSLLHGNEGEDGAYQGLAEIFNINGSFGDLLPSGISMNKWAMSELAESVTKHNINSIPYIKLNATSTKTQINNFIKQFPSEYYILKPNKLGASLFVKKINKNKVLSFFNSKEFKDILKYDKNILLQKYMVGREFTLGILQKGNDIIDLPIVEIFTKDNFLGHEEKHKKGLVNVTFNKVEKKLTKKMVDNSKLLFKELDFSNFCRFDYILSEDKLYLLEINSIPGLMHCSIFVKMLDQANIKIPKMIDIFSKNKQYKPLKDFRYEIE